MTIPAMGVALMKTSPQTAADSGSLGPFEWKPPMTTTLLVTVLGTNPKPARYTLDGRSVEAVLAPLALVQLLPADRRPSGILALCTAEAKEQGWPILQRGLAGSGINAAIVDIGADPTDVSSFLRVVTTAIPVESAPDGLMIDATHGFRHYALLAYLTIPVPLGVARD